MFILEILEEIVEIKEITAAIKDLKNVEFVIAGGIIDNELLDRMLRVSNVKYKGVLDQATL